MYKSRLKRKGLLFENLEHLRSEFAAQLAELWSGTYQEKDLIIQNLEVEFEFSAQL